MHYNLSLSTLQTLTDRLRVRMIFKRIFALELETINSLQTTYYPFVYPFSIVLYPDDDDDDIACSSLCRLL